MSPAVPFAPLLDSTAGRVLMDPAGFVRVHWSSQPRTFAETCAMLTTAATALERNGWGRILTNQINMQPFSPREQQWLTQEWLPVAVHTNGYRFGAVVVATNVLTRLATAFVTTSFSDMPLRYRSFDAEAEAVAWLLRQPQ
ncbi:MAG: STAS/SEC14 domain-containing protein [Janthinobacterium lividum]